MRGASGALAGDLGLAPLCDVQVLDLLLRSGKRMRESLWDAIVCLGKACDDLAIRILSSSQKGDQVSSEVLVGESPCTSRLATLPDCILLKC